MALPVFNLQHTLVNFLVVVFLFAVHGEVVTCAMLDAAALLPALLQDLGYLLSV